MEKQAFLNHCDMVARHPNDLITIQYRCVLSLVAQILIV